MKTSPAKNESREDPINSFESPSTDIVGLDYDSIREGFWLACQDGKTYLVNAENGTIIKEIDMVGITIADNGDQTGVDVLPSGNLLFADYNGDLTNIQEKHPFVPTQPQR